MKLSYILIILGLVSLLISVAIFMTVYEEKRNVCPNFCEHKNYLDAFRIMPWCVNICDSFDMDSRAEPIEYKAHNPIYVLFLYLGIILVLAGIIHRLRKH